MKIFLTGGGGMVGKNLTKHPSASSYIFLTPSSNELDLRNYEKVLAFIKENKPDFIIHAAGLVGGIQANMRDPLGFLSSNLDIGRNIVMASKEAGIKNLLNLGSSCMYPRDATNPLKEEYILKGSLEPTNEGYAIAKIVVAKFCQYINQQHPDFLYKTAIPCNLYGPYDKFDPRHSHMIPAVIKKIDDAVKRNQEKVEIWGDGTARREFMYAGDLADFIIYALNNFGRMPGVLNVGLGEDYTINEYYEMVGEVCGYKGFFERDLSKPVGMKQKLIDDTLLSEFGWKHRYSLKEGLEKTYSYYKSYVQ